MRSPRIPAWVGAVWDLVERRPWPTLLAAGTAVTGVAAIWRPSVLLVFLVAYFAFMAGAGLFYTQLAEARHERDEHRADAIAKDQELSQMREVIRSWNASASTLQITPIGDRGETT
jgi:hypothetical protein